MTRALTSTTRKWPRVIYSSYYCHNQIGSIHFPVAILFFRGCVPEMFVTSYSVTYCIYITGKPGICFIISVQFIMSTNSGIRFGLQIELVCLYFTPLLHQYCANLSEDIEFIKIACQIYFVESVSKIKHILPVIHYTICEGCFFSCPISLAMIEKIYILCHIIIIKSEVWTITHCLMLGHEAMVCAVCISILLVNLRHHAKHHKLISWLQSRPTRQKQ